MFFSPLTIYTWVLTLYLDSGVSNSCTYHGRIRRTQLDHRDCRFCHDYNMIVITLNFVYGLHVCFGRVQT